MQPASDIVGFFEESESECRVARVAVNRFIAFLPQDVQLG